MTLPDFLIRRDPFTSKTDYGHALLIAGAYGKMGCAVLSSRACLRTGTGLLTVHVPQKGVSVLQTAIPEAMTSIDSDPEIFSTLPLHLDRYSAVAIGPGIGTGPQTAEALRSLLTHLPKETPLIIDADGLNLLSRERDLLDRLPRNVILTPHSREFDRLWGSTLTDDATRHQAALQLAQKLRATILLKGHTTLIASPDGHKVFNTTGNAGMATAGSGDVLTGILLGLTAQNAMVSSAKQLSMAQIAHTGAFLHGKSGDFAVRNQAECTLIASDLVENLKYVIA